jgi:XTP/dITP diphosphohydrolase
MSSEIGSQHRFLRTVANSEVCFCHRGTELSEMIFSGNHVVFVHRRPVSEPEADGQKIKTRRAIRNSVPDESERIVVMEKKKPAALDRPIVLATRNKGKIREFESLLAEFPVTIKSLEDFGPIPPVVEDGETFEENAVKKARHTARVLGLPAIADDSGLEVAALQGGPGVRSARYAGETAVDHENNLKLLDALKGVENRSARFVCVLAIAVPRGPALIYDGVCEGQITREMMGSNGFGYDPVFFYPPLGRTFAQLSGNEKNRVSHRGSALAELRDEFEKVLQWMRHRLSEEPF